MSETPTNQQEQESSPEAVATQRLGAVCHEIITAADALAMTEGEGTGIKAGHIGERKPLPQVSTLGATSVRVSDVMLPGGEAYEVDMTHSDDVVDDEAWGVYDPSHPQAYYRMTFKQIIDTPEGKAEKTAFSVEMFKQLNGNPIDVDGNPSSIIAWDLSDPGSAEYLKGQSLLESDQFTVMRQVSEQLNSAAETQFNRILLSS